MIQWPDKTNLFGVEITPTNYDEATQIIVEAAKQGHRGLVSCYSTHSLVETSRHRSFSRAANTFEMIAPDGQPIRWALNWLKKKQLTDRVYGPELTLRVCKKAAEGKIPIYLYGSSPQAIKALIKNLVNHFPGLVIAGAESPPYRSLTRKEELETIRRINASGARILFIGLGYPKQDIFALKHREQLNQVQICVGAAFDFHAKIKKTAPAWMQASGLEWFFRLSQEPSRLWKRYLVTNSLYLLMLIKAFLASREQAYKGGR
jgi:N-acetylglucosaminyldiphosphoundecaprenol N-acetyl-beta-D-mannosaminyltransferase